MTLNFSRRALKIPFLVAFPLLLLIIGCGEGKKERDSSSEPMLNQGNEATAKEQGNETTTSSKQGSKTLNSNQDKQSISPNKTDRVAEYMAEGEKIYLQYCLTCHQANGSGVSRLNPPLKGTEYVLGDKNRLIGIIIIGANVGLNVNGKTYSNAMPAFKQLSNQEIADVTSYIRNSFGNSAVPITVEEVSAFRTKNKG